MIQQQLFEACILQQVVVQIWRATCSNNDAYVKNCKYVFKEVLFCVLQVSASSASTFYDVESVVLPWATKYLLDKASEKCSRALDKRLLAISMPK